MMEETKRLAIEQLERVSKNLASIGETVDYTELAIEALEQEPKTGLWEIIPKDEWDSSTAPHIKCTMCNRRPFGDVPFAFCPNCGAKMVEPQESEKK